jgi:predicted ATPase
MKFCGECGTPFKNRCPQCGFENPPRFKFCGECGSPLALRPSASQTSDAGLRTPDSSSPQPPVSYIPKHLAERILAEQAAQEQAEALIALSREHGFAFHLATGTMVRGWALAEQGQEEEGIAQMHQGVAALQTTGGELGRVVWAAPLAAAYGRVRRPEERLTLLTEALAAVDKTGGRFQEAEMYRIKGELTLAQSSVQRLASSVQKEAEECFLKAIEIARRQQAKSWELRAVMSLSRLWQQQGKKEEARQMLAEIYAWFTEGFDTTDLKDAKALLEELQG